MYPFSSLQFGAVYVKMRGAPWLECHPGSIPTKVTVPQEKEQDEANEQKKEKITPKKKIRDEFRKSKYAEGLIISSTHGIFREDPSIYWKHPETKGTGSKLPGILHNHLKPGRINGLGIVLTGADTEILGIKEINPFIEALNEKLGGRRRIVGLQPLKNGTLLKEKSTIIISSSPTKQHTIELVGENVFDKTARSRVRI